MDYEGQKLSELLFYWIIIAFGAVGWVIGYFQESFVIVFQCWLVGVIISVLVRELHLEMDSFVVRGFSKMGQGLKGENTPSGDPE